MTGEAAFDWHEAEKEQMDGLNTTVPHSARIWSYWQGGKDYYRIDQQVGDRVAAVFPGIGHEVRCSRYFLARAVRYLAAEAGIRQFLDIGAGLPAADNTHAIAQRVDANCRVVYADNDPLVLAHARALLTSDRGAATGHVLADLRDTETILAKAHDTLDLTQPVAVILTAVLGHLPGDRDACSAVARLMAAVPPGSYLVASDGTDVNPAHVAAMRLYEQSGAAPYRLRSPQQIARFFDGLELDGPGVVPYNTWRPDPSPFDPAGTDGVGGVARKPGPKLTRHRRGHSAEPIPAHLDLTGAPMKTCERSWRAGAAAA